MAVNEALHYRSAALTHIGRVRTINQDAFLEREEAGLWVVADGMGGHECGEMASRMICDALAAWLPDGTLKASVQGVQRCLADVNAHLYRLSRQAIDPIHSGSTVVALITRGNRYAIMWAGDSRVYRLRAGELMQLTRDHVISEDEDPLGDFAHAITRAVGGESLLEVEVIHGNVKPGDRYLLCSDGLNHEVSERDIHECLQQNNIRRCADDLVEAALEAGGTDNVTVVVLDAFVQ